MYSRPRRSSSVIGGQTFTCPVNAHESFFHVSLPNSPGEGAHVARRIVAIAEAIADAVAEDDEILVDHRRRRIGVVLLVDRPDQPFAQIGPAVIAERLHRQAGFRVEADQVVAAVHEDSQPVAIAPRGDAAVHEALPACRRAIFVGFRIVRPQLAARFGIERDDAVVRRAEIQHVVDHDRRVLERAGRRAELLQWRFAGFPRPRRLQPADVLAGDLRERRILHPALIVPVGWPFNQLRRLLAGAGQRQAGHTHQCKKRLLHRAHQLPAHFPLPAVGGVRGVVAGPPL
jgi:hypothetical protein